METRGRMLLDEYKKWSLRAKKDMFIFVVEIVAVCVKGGCRNPSFGLATKAKEVARVRA
jgi:hypothetical protein